MIDKFRSTISNMMYGSDGFKKENFTITLTDLNTCLNTFSYEPSSFSKELLLENLNSLNNRNEVAMFLAHIFHESEGLKYKEEIDKSNNYMTELGKKDKSYHGRGYMMITWPENYYKFGQSLGLNDEFLNNPEKLMSDELAIQSAIWYWKEIVRKAKGVGDDNFWSSTMAINGALESSGEGIEKAKHRYNMYVSISRVLGLHDFARK